MDVLWLLLVFLAALVLIIGGMIYACYQGVRALRLSRGQQGDYALILRMIGLNLCEPLANTLFFVPIMALAQSLTTFFILLAPAILPLLAVGGAAVGLHISTRGPHLGRYLYQDMLWLSTGRLVVTLLMLGGMWLSESEYAPSGFNVWCLSALCYMIAIILHWGTALWGKDQLNGTLQQPPFVPSVSPPAPASPPAPIATTAIGTATLPDPDPTEPPVPYLLCSICHAPTPRNASECPECGLVFTSRVPASLHHLRDYHVLRPLGGGGMSSVYLARQQESEELSVIKTLASVEKLADPHWQAEAARCLRQEADLLRQLDHPHIAQVREWVSSEYGEFLVLEYVAGLTLEQRLTRPDGQGNILPGNPLPVDEALQHGCTVAAILEYLACLPQPLVHHDIKPANLILREADGVLVLVDFGGAVVLPDSDAATVQLDRYGTPGYAAPEQYQGHSSPQSDIYGLAATLYHLLTDDDPADHPFQFPHLPTLPTEVRTVLEPALSHEPNARPTARTLRRALQMVLGG